MTLHIFDSQMIIFSIQLQINPFLFMKFDANSLKIILQSPDLRLIPENLGFKTFAVVQKLGTCIDSSQQLTFLLLIFL